MKKYIYLLLSTAILFGCVDEMGKDDGSTGKTETPDIPVAYEENEVVAGLASGFKKVWSQDDSISVYTTRGHFVTFTLVEGAGEPVAKFKADLREDEQVLQYAAYPAGSAVYRQGQLLTVLPSEYGAEGYEQIQPMAGVYDEETGRFDLDPISGSIAITMKNVPQEAAAFRFHVEDGSMVTGEFAIDDNWEAVTPAGDGNSTITMSFSSSSSDDMTFWFPLPAGEYSRYSIGFIDADGQLMTSTVRLMRNLTVAKGAMVTIAGVDVVNNVFYVKENGTGSGTSWEDASSLTAALEDAGFGAKICLAAGTYVPEKILDGSLYDTDQYRTFHVRRNVEIVGGYPSDGGEDSQIDTAANVTVISGHISEDVYSYHAMTVAVPDSDGKVVLRNLVFADGRPLDAEGASTVVVTSDGVSVPDYRGGGLYAGSDVEMYGCTVKNNSAAVHSGTSGTTGVGVYIPSGVTAHVSRTSFENNSGGSVGAAIHSMGVLSLDRCRFEGNSSNQGGALYTSSGSELKSMEHCAFVNNTAEDMGGAFYNNVPASNISNCRFEGNSASHSGAIHNVTQMVLTSSVFKSNSSKGYAGAVRSHSNSNTTFDGCTFESNEAANEGGAIHNNRAKVTIRDCEFKSNKARNGGAFANWGGATATVEGSVFTDNEASANGGAIINMYSAQNGVIKETELTVSESTFTGNRCTGSGYNSVGGALANQLATAIVSSCTFSGNSAPNGAAIHSHDTKPSDNKQYSTEGDFTKASLYLYNSLLSGNTSSNQGAVRVIGTGYGVIVNTTITGSTSTTGAIRARMNSSSQGGTIWLINSTLSGNSTGFFDQGFASNVLNTILYANATTGFGDYAYNNTTGTNVLKSVVTGAEYRSKAISSSTMNCVYAADGTAVSSPVFAEGWLGSFNSTLGVFPVTGAPATTEGMAYETLAATGEGSLAAEITAVMPEFEAKYLTQDQKGNSREGKTIMGAYVGK